MNVSIVIPTKDASADMASRAIEAARRTTAHLSATLEIIERSGPEFRFSRSINEGIRRSPDADAWVLLNDDAFMDDGWLDAMLDAMRAHPEVGVWGALLRFPDGRVQHAGGRIPIDPLEYLGVALRHRAPFWALRRIREQRFRRHGYMFDHYDRLRASNRLDFITGACAMITRACLEKVGDYDERYFFGAEDVDHSLRALDAGFELGLATRATGIHVDGGSGGHGSPRQLASWKAFHERWSGDEIRRLTRRGGRVGVYHPGG